MESTKPITKPKFPKRADGVFGVCAPVPNGKPREGRKMRPLRYKGTVVGVVAYFKGMQSCIAAAREIGRVNRRKVKAGTARKGCWHDHAEFDGPGGPYQSRFGDRWMEKLPASFKLVCITSVMDHVIAEGNRLFADIPFANTWKIYHDALPQWWEKGAQEHMKARGFYDRQWMARGETNAKVGRYKNKLMGDSPELMPLDSSLFSDLIEGIALHVVATAKLPKGEKYSMGTPDEAWRTMIEVWMTAVPSPGRIVQDIDRFSTALDRIIAVMGCYVEELDCCHGHRKAMQIAVTGGAINMKNGSLTAKAVEGLSELKKS